MRLGSRIGAVLALGAVLGCSSPSPEERIRARIAEAEEAAEAGDLRALRDLVAPDYSDAEGRDKRAIDGLVAFYLTRNRSLHVLADVRSIRLVARDEAEVELLVAVAASPISGPGALANLDADLLRIDLDLRAAGGADWKVTSAGWRRAELSDFF
jgi:hypothetical protein